MPLLNTKIYADSYVMLDWFIITQTKSWYEVQSHNVQNGLTKTFNNNNNKNTIKFKFGILIT